PLRRWTIAHELGHFVLGHPAPPAGELYRPHQRCRRRDRRHQEDEANSFASVLLIPGRDLAECCDTRPMTLDAPLRLADLCDVPLAASALRLTEVSWRTCAIVVSIKGVMLGVWPSLTFLCRNAGRIWRGDPLLPGSLARRFFDSGEPCGPPALVPASAWLNGADPGLQLQEHSVAMAPLDAVVTMLMMARNPAETMAADRPKLMTVLTMMIGLIPVLWSTGTGADVMKRIAAPMVVYWFDVNVTVLGEGYRSRSMGKGGSCGRLVEFGAANAA
ncbi:MAG: ImmA/IrrE family metallo-endopeptidase, partial [Solirubrobacterales bacterium]